jgi:hypothetical protein
MAIFRGQTMKVGKDTQYELVVKGKAVDLLYYVMFHRIYMWV